MICLKNMILQTINNLAKFNIWMKWNYQIIFIIEINRIEFLYFKMIKLKIQINQDLKLYLEIVVI